MIRLAVFFVLLLSLAACQHPKQMSAEEVQADGEQVQTVLDQLSAHYCPTVREYITTFEYLKTKKNYYKHDWARGVSHQVSKGCKGAALRFIKVFELMVKADAYGDDAAKIAIEASLAGEDVTNSYIEVFQKSYLKNYLDLDLDSSVKLARGLSFQYKGNAKFAKNDFAKLVKFCVGQQSLDLSKPVCAKLSYRLALYGQETPTGVYEPFMVAFNYFTKGKGPRITTAKALNISEKLIKVSPMAVYNFIKAYEYGISETGLDLPVGAAIKFAKSMGDGSVRLPSSIIKTEIETVGPK